MSGRPRPDGVGGGPRERVWTGDIYHMGTLLVKIRLASLDKQTRLKTLPSRKPRKRAVNSNLMCNTFRERYLIVIGLSVLDTPHVQLIWFVIILKILIVCDEALQCYSQSRRPRGCWPFHDFTWYDSWNSHGPWVEPAAGMAPRGRPTGRMPGRWLCE